MPTSARDRLGPRDSAPENRLFDSACRLVEASRELARAAGRPGAEPAIAPTLGCLEDALTNLAEALVAMRMSSRAGLDDPALRDSVAGRLAAAETRLASAAAASDSARDVVRAANERRMK